MVRSIEHDVEHILKAVISDRIRGLPGHTTTAMKSAVTRLLPYSVSYVKDLSHYYEGLYVSVVIASIESESYTIKMCYDSGYFVCFKNKSS